MILSRRRAIQQRAVAAAGAAASASASALAFTLAASSLAASASASAFTSAEVFTLAASTLAASALASAFTYTASEVACSFLVCLQPVKTSEQQSKARKMIVILSFFISVSYQIYLP